MVITNNLVIFSDKTNKTPWKWKFAWLPITTTEGSRIFFKKYLMRSYWGYECKVHNRGIILIPVKKIQRVSDVTKLLLLDE